MVGNRLLSSALASLIGLIAGCSSGSSTAPALERSAIGGGTTYYVSTSGSDSNPGTASAPFRRVSRGVNAAHAGDTVIVMDGTYDNEGVVARSSAASVVSMQSSGASGSPITIRAQNRGKAILDGGNGNTGSVSLDSAPYPCNGAWTYFDLTGVSYVTIEGFVIQHLCVGGIRANGNPGFDHDLTFRWNEIRNIGDTFANTGNGGPQGIYLDQYAHDIVFDGNSWHDIGNVASTSNSQNHGIYSQAQNVTIVNNTFYGIPSGWAIQVAPGTANLLVANNTFADVDPHKSGQIVLWDDGDGVSQPLSNVTIRNNVFLNASGWAIDTYLTYPMRGCSIDHNLTTASSVYVSSSPCTLASNVTGTDPKLVQESAPYDFHLSAGSPAIGAGVNLSSSFTSDFSGKARPASGAWDLGAYASASASSGGGSGAAEITFSPPLLVFPNQPVSTTSAIQFTTVTNPSATTVTLPQSLTITGAGFAFGGLGTCGTSLAPGATCTISVKFTPPSAGTFEGSVTVADDTPCAPHMVPLVGLGI